MDFKKCSDCGGDLEIGAPVDFTYGGTLAQRWAKVELKDEKQKGVLITEAGFEDLRRIISYRCIKCNRLFEYAQNTVQTKSLRSEYQKFFVILIVVISIMLLFGAGLSSIN